MSTLTAPRPISRIRSLLEVVPDVRCVQLPIVNVYLVGEPEAGDREWVLVDAGLRVSQGRIERAAAERFGADSRPSAIVLTPGLVAIGAALVARRSSRTRRIEGY